MRDVPTQPDPRRPAPPGLVRRLRWRGWATAGAALLLLCGVAAQQHLRHRPADWDEYHRRAAAAVAALPMTVNGEAGLWMGRDRPPPRPARELLRPNAVRQVAYGDYSPQGLTGAGDGPRRADLLVVQSRRAEDMLGHHPPICYPASGSTVLGRRPRTLNLIDPLAPDDPSRRLRVRAIEYALLDPDPIGGPPLPGRSAGPGRATRTVVSFLILPGKGREPGRIVPDVEALRRAAEDYRQRRRGAAQVQLLLPGPPPATAGADDWRGRATLDLLSAAVPTIRVLLGETSGPAGTLPPPRTSQTTASPTASPQSPALPDGGVEGR